MSQEPRPDILPVLEEICADLLAIRATRRGPDELMLYLGRAITEIRQLREATTHYAPGYRGDESRTMITIEVRRAVPNRVLYSTRMIEVAEWLEARDPGCLAKIIIDNALAEISRRTEVKPAT